MPRLPRIHIEDALYYITNRSESSLEIFKDGDDYKMFLDLLKKYKQQYGFRLFAYSLMSNHFHLLLELAQQKEEGKRTGVSEIMHSQNSSYTKYFNRKYNRKGHLFRERFKAAIVEKRPYLLKMTAYIHLNAKRLDPAIDPTCYPYSSYVSYLDKEIPLSDLTQEEQKEILGLLEQKTYEEFMGTLDEKVDLDFHKQLHKGRVLGSDEFLKRVRSEFIASMKKEEIEEPAEKVAINKKKISAFTVVIVLVGVGLLFLLKLSLKEKKESASSLGMKSKINSEKNLQEESIKAAALEVSEDLDGIKWQIQLTSGTGEQDYDTISFDKQKFTSGKLNAKGYSVSHYSFMVQDNGVAIWETVQSAPDGTVASWHGEIEKDLMSGALSLKEKDKEPRDYSFKSIKYWRKK